MAYAHRTDITVPIMTPTESTHPTLPSPRGSPLPPHHASIQTQSHPLPLPYSPANEDAATKSILTSPSSIPDVAASSIPLNASLIKEEAQGLIDTHKFTTKKAFRAFLEEEMAGLIQEVEERARRREDGRRVNEGVEEEVKQRTMEFETERRALAKRMQQGEGK
jgi:hypothetical protein